MQHVNLTGLSAALSSATGGETLVLQGGDYGKLNLSKVDFPDTVTITSADAGNPAVFSGLGLSKVNNLTFDSVVFDYTFTPDDLMRIRPFEVKDSQHVTIRNSVFDGDLARGMSAVDDGYGTGYALSVRGSSDIAVESNEFSDFARAAIFDDITDLSVTGNNVHRISSDGMDFVRVQDVLIEGNFMHDFLRSPESGAHPDMIQFWTTGTREPSGNITIRGNILSAHKGRYTQSIFMRNEMVGARGAGKEMYYRNILIEDNIIINAHLHGITVGEADGLIIRNNTVVRNAKASGDSHKASLWTPRIHLSKASRNVQVLRNVTSAVDGYDGQSDWKIADNLLVQDQARLKPGFYGDVFDPAALSAPERIESFAPRRGGPLDGTGIGAPMLAALPPQP